MVKIHRNNGDTFRTESLGYEEAVALAADSGGWFAIEYRPYDDAVKQVAFPAASVTKIEHCRY